MIKNLLGFLLSIVAILAFALIVTFPATWLLMLFMGNLGLGMSYWGSLPLGSQHLDEGRNAASLRDTAIGILILELSAEILHALAVVLRTLGQEACHGHCAGQSLLE